MLDMGMTFDFAQFVIDNEIFKMIRKVIDGISVTDANMAVDIIKEVGPGGEFLTQQHTFDNFKKEQSHSKLFDRSMRETWVIDGETNLTERAYAEANNILNNFTPLPLPEDIVQKIHSIVEEAEKEYAAEKE
jgi:trimethylamine:corrinoid methyltransferase-like protein